MIICVFDFLSLQTASRLLYEGNNICNVVMTFEEGGWFREAVIRLYRKNTRFYDSEPLGLMLWKKL